MSKQGDRETAAREQSYVLTPKGALVLTVKALEALRHSQPLPLRIRDLALQAPCWCDVAVDNPMLGGHHTEACKLARAAYTAGRRALGEEWQP